MNFPTTRLNWRPAYRVIPSRFPAIGLFERVASPEDFDALYALEAMTNDRLRDEVGDISLVPADERLFGPGSTCIMAAFTHPNPQGSRFSDGRYGVFYCARKRDTAIAETRHHAARFMEATREPPMRLQMRLYAVQARGEAVDLREAARSDPRIVDPDGYGHTQAIGRSLRAAGAHGIVYPSVRHPGGECLAALRTGIVKNCLHAAYLEYQWNGERIEAVFEVNQVQ
ncbi:MAG: RES family NAD+ phosphorylase [Betaproteobacteria bacterium]|nr:RES family NAD+ phosphorylase [Betaproteobacteria bacterium]